MAQSILVGDPKIEIIVTSEGEGWIPGSGRWQAFLNLVSDPVAHGGEYLGEGSEGIVYRVEWEGRTIAAKVFNQKAQSLFDRVSQERPIGHFTPSFSRPHFLRRAGFLPRLMEVIADIPKLPFDICGVQDFAFGEDFHVMEFIPDAMPLCKLIPETEDGVKEDRTEEAETFLRRFTLDEVQLYQAKLILQVVQETVAVVQETDWFRNMRLDHDVVNNVLVKQRNREGRLQLVLIDQGSEPPSFCDPAAILDEVYARRSYEAAESMYLLLLTNPAYAAFLSKYFPGGFPKKKFYA